MGRILLIGRNGQLARALRKCLDADGRAFDCVGSDTVDLCKNPNDIIAYIHNQNIAAVINASGFTDVDGAETAADAAHVLNAVAPGVMALTCRERSIPFIHISTDYVFDGDATVPYRPQAVTHPINVYGQTKLAGEAAVKAAGGSSAIVRTSWVYDGTGKNFLTSMLRLAKTKTSVSVINDQFGRPTYAEHLAEACLKLLDNMPATPSVFHVTNSGNTVSWATFASEIFSEAQVKCKIIPIPTSEYPTPAKRPAYSVLSLEEFEIHTGHKMPNWKDGLKMALKERE